MAATRKELFNRIAVEMADDPEVVAMCEKYIAALSKPRPRKANPEVTERQATIATWLSEQGEGLGFTQAEVGEALGMKPAQAGFALRALVESGIAYVLEGKKSDPKRYGFVR